MSIKLLSYESIDLWRCSDGKLSLNAIKFCNINERKLKLGMIWYYLMDFLGRFKKSIFNILILQHIIEDWYGINNGKWKRRKEKGEGESRK